MTRTTVSRVLPGLCLAFAMVLMAGCGTELQPTQPGTAALTGTLASLGLADARPTYVAGEVIVKFTAGASAARRGAALEAVRGTVKSRLLTEAMKRSGDHEGLTVVRTQMAVLDAIRALRACPGVQYAEPNCYFYQTEISDDPYYLDGTLWNMYGDTTTPTNPFGIHAGEAWAAGHIGSASVLVGVIDGDVMLTHPDLAGQIWTNPYDPLDGIDNDGNGYVDDIHGWDFCSDDNTTYDVPWEYHGTHVAGTIGAKGGNGVGVAGVCWNIGIICGKIFAEGTDKGEPIRATMDDVVRTIDYMTDLRTRHGLNLVATNNSWGGYADTYLQSVEDAVERANQADILFVCGSGNLGVDCDVVSYYCSCLPNTNVITVAAIDSAGAMPSWRSASVVWRAGWVG